MSRLGLGLGLTKGGVIPFNPLSLDPYLLFDTQSSMIGTFENPTLDLDPANPSTLDVITATRAGVATYTDADGLIQSASPNTTRVDYTQGAELTPTVYQRVGYTDFSSGWSNTNTTAVAGDGFEGEPSMLVTSTAGLGRYQITIPNTVEGREYRLSFSIKELINSGDVRFRTGSAGGGSSANFETPITSEWTRVEATILGRVGGGNVTFGVEIVTSGGSVEISQPQLEEGTTASDFVANTTGSPKFITGATYGPRVPMILVEPSATNLFRNSQDLTASPNSIANATITQESETFKGQPVFRITDDTSSGEHRLSISAGSVTASRVIVHFYVKADTCTKFCITYPTAGDAGAAWNLSSGSSLGSTVGSAVAQTIEDAGDGWFKVSMTYDRPSATTTGHNIQTLQDSATSAANRSYQGNGTLSFLMTMPQLEYGEVPTSFIPTSGSTVTRAADQLSLSTSVTSSFFSSTDGGTFYAEFVPRDVLSEQWYLLAGQDYNRRFMYTNAGNAQLRAFDGTTNRTYGSNMVANQLNRAAFTYTATTQEASLDGSAVAVFSNNGNYLTTSRLYLASPVNDRQMNGHLKRLIYWPVSSDSL